MADDISRPTERDQADGSQTQSSRRDATQGEVHSPDFATAAKRLAWLRAKLDLTLDEFGKKCNYHGSHISRVEKGAVTPGRRLMLVVCDSFDVREEWLKDGHQPVFNGRGEKRKPVPLTVDEEIVDSLIRTVQHVSTLPPGGRRLAASALHEMVDSLCRDSEVGSSSEIDPDYWGDAGKRIAEA